MYICTPKLNIKFLAHLSLLDAGDDSITPALNRCPPQIPALSVGMGRVTENSECP